MGLDLTSAKRIKEMKPFFSVLRSWTRDPIGEGGYKHDRITDLAPCRQASAAVHLVSAVEP